jgi:glycosyltransferase involved in cell wall biosynthesis
LPKERKVALNKLRIGYVPYSVDLSRPGDRRRFCYYARKRNITFEIAKPYGNYDLVIVTEWGDLSVWSRYKKGKAKMVYDFIDSYLSIPRYDLKGIFRGLAKFIARQSRYPQLNYWRAIEEMCRRSDAVICTTEEQREDILKFCDNVHIILDFHGNVVRYSSGDIFNFIWEGLPGNIRSLYEISEVLRQLSSKYKIALHIVTDLEYYKYLGRYVRQKTSKITLKLFDNIHLYAWDENSCSSIITGCDLAIIPLSMNDPLVAGKPENKLLLFWRMGMPTVVSATPAYQRAMRQCGLPMACRTKNEWLEILEKYIKDKVVRQDAGERGRKFCENQYNEEGMLAQWDEVLESVAG